MKIRFHCFIISMFCILAATFPCRADILTDKFLSKRMAELGNPSLALSDEISDLVLNPAQINFTNGKTAYLNLNSGSMLTGIILPSSACAYSVFFTGFNNKDSASFNYGRRIKGIPAGINILFEPAGSFSATLSVLPVKNEKTETGVLLNYSQLNSITDTAESIYSFHLNYYQYYSSRTDERLWSLRSNNHPKTASLSVYRKFPFLYSLQITGYASLGTAAWENTNYDYYWMYSSTYQYTESAYFESNTTQYEGSKNGSSSRIVLGIGGTKQYKSVLLCAKSEISYQEMSSVFNGIFIFDESSNRIDYSTPSNNYTNRSFSQGTSKSDIIREFGIDSLLSIEWRFLKYCYLRKVIGIDFSQWDYENTAVSGTVTKYHSGSYSYTYTEPLIPSNSLFGLSANFKMKQNLTLGIIYSPIENLLLDASIFRDTANKNDRLALSAIYRF